MLEALKLARQKEIKGSQDNPEIIKLFNELGLNGNKLHDETAWCAAFVNCCLKRAGLPYNIALNARSFLSYGEPTDNPELGDIVVFWRESEDSWKGHVAFYIREEGQYVYVLGGNQSNEVKVSAYHQNRLLDFRKVNYENI